MNEYPRRIKQHLRELTATVHERAVRAHLEQLADDFQRWRAGTLDTWELTDRIHRFHDGPSRELFSQYNQGEPGLNVAHAIATGLLKESEVPGEVLQALAGLIAIQRSWAQEEGGEPEEPG